LDALFYLIGKEEDKNPEYKKVSSSWNPSYIIIMDLKVAKKEALIIPSCQAMEIAAHGITLAPERA